MPGGRPRGENPTAAALRKREARAKKLAEDPGFKEAELQKQRDHRAQAKLGKVYRITCRETSDTYIGSTEYPLTCRMNQHRYAARKIEPKQRLYRCMNENDPGSFEIELLETYPEANREELLTKEGEWIRKLTPSLNMLMPGRPPLIQLPPCPCGKGCFGHRREQHIKREAKRQAYRASVAANREGADDDDGVANDGLS